MNAAARTVVLALGLAACSEQPVPVEQLPPPPAGGAAFEAVPRSFQTADPEAARLLPADAVAVAHVRNPAGVVEQVARIADAFQPGMAGMVTLAPLLSPTGLRERELDLAGEALVALRLGDAGPEPTLVLPARKPAEAAVTAAMEALAAGKYLALSPGAEPKAGDPQPLTRELLAGDVAVRLDAPKLLAPWLPMVGRFLDANTLGQLAPGIPAAQLAGLQPVLDFAKSVLAGLRQVDLAVSVRDGAVDVDAVVTVSEDLADRSTGDFDLLKRLPLPDANVLVYARVDWHGLIERYGKAMSGVTIPGAPDPRSMERLMQKATRMYATLGNELVAAYRLDADRFEVVGHSHGGRPAQFVAALHDYAQECQQLLRSLSAPQRIRRLPDRITAGLPLSGYQFPIEHEPGMPARHPFKDGLGMLVGERGEDLFVVTPSAEQRLQGLVDGAAAGARYRLALLDAVRGLHSAPKLFFALDLRSLLGMAATFAGQPVPAGPPVLLWGALGGSGTRYELQLHVDLLALGQLTRQLR